MMKLSQLAGSMTGKEPTGIFAPLAVRDFRRLFRSNALWWLTLFMEFLAQGFIVLEMTDSPWLVSVAGFCRSLPLLVVGSFGGRVAERFGRRRVILFAQTANLCLYATIATLLWLDRLALWHIYAAALGLGTAWAMDWPSRRALLPDLVGKARTVEAMLLENFAQGTARMAGPALAGAVLAGFSAAGCYTLMAGFSAFTLLSLRTLSGHSIPRTSMRAQTSPWTALGQSLRYAGQSKPILGVLIVTVIMNFLIVPYMTLLPVFARDVLGKGPSGLGFLGTAAGIGSFIGLIVIIRIRGEVGNGWIFVTGTFGASIALIAFSQSTSYGFSWLMLVLAGMGQSAFGIMQSSIILLTASDEMRSDTMGLLVLAIGSDPLGKLQTGFLAQNYGAQTAVGLQAAAAALALVVTVLAVPGLLTQTPPVKQRAVAGD